MVSAGKSIFLILIFISLTSIAEACFRSLFSREKCDELCQQCTSCRGAIPCYMHCANCGICRYEREEGQRRLSKRCTWYKLFRKSKSSPKVQSDSVDESERLFLSIDQLEKQLRNSDFRGDALQNASYQENKIPKPPAKINASSASSVKNYKKYHHIIPSIVFPILSIASNILSAQSNPSKKLSDPSIEGAVSPIAMIAVSSMKPKKLSDKLPKPSELPVLPTEDTRSPQIVLQNGVLDSENGEVATEDHHKQEIFSIPPSIQHEKPLDPSVRKVSLPTSQQQYSTNETKSELLASPAEDTRSAQSVLEYGVLDSEKREVATEDHHKQEIFSIPPSIQHEKPLDPSVRKVSLPTSQQQYSTNETKPTNASAISNEECKEPPCRDRHIQMADQSILNVPPQNAALPVVFLPDYSMSPEKKQELPSAVLTQQNATYEPDAATDQQLLDEGCKEPPCRNRSTKSRQPIQKDHSPNPPLPAVFTLSPSFLGRNFSNSPKPVEILNSPASSLIFGTTLHGQKVITPPKKRGQRRNRTLPASDMVRRAQILRNNRNAKTKQ